MNPSEIEARRRSREAQEIYRESRETKENEDNAELKAAAAMERADYLVREVKTNKNQMQNIMLHMQAVLQAIRDLRSALALPQSRTDEASTVQDKKRVEDLKQKILEYKDELLKMKDELFAEQIALLKQKQPAAAEETLRQEAEMMVKKILAEVEKE